MAIGLQSQYILVLPKLEIVAVMTGTSPQFYGGEKLTDEIAATVRSDDPLPPASNAQSLLAASIQKAASEQASQVGVTPELAKTVSGKTYKFRDNDLRVRTFSINLLGSNPSWEITTATQRLDRPTARFSGPLGLEGLFRKGTLAPYGIDAVKGSWLDDNTFAMERRILGHGEMQRWTLAFDGKKVDINFESTDGAKAELHGEADE
jgi:hypothetical protein